MSTSLKPAEQASGIEIREETPADLEEQRSTEEQVHGPDPARQDAEHQSSVLQQTHQSQEHQTSAVSGSQVQEIACVYTINGTEPSCVALHCAETVSVMKLSLR